MSSSVQCFPMLQAAFNKPSEASLNMFSNLASTTSSSSSDSMMMPSLPAITQNSANFFEKFLNTQQLDTVAYLQALSQSALTSFASMPQNSSTSSSASSTMESQTSPFNHLLSAAIGNERNNNNSILLNQQKITKRRNRTTFTHEQATLLEKEYSQDQYMPRSRRAIVAENLCLTEGQVKTWFQNRRAKDKRTDKLNVIQQGDAMPSTASATLSPPSQHRSIVSGIGSGPKPMNLQTFDTNFLMPVMNGGIHSTPSPSSSATSSISHSPLSPLSPLFGSNNMPFGNMDANSSAATLAALYMQALQLQTSIASTIVSS